MTARDRDRAAVYAAEEAAFAGTDLESPVPLGDLVALSSAITLGEWWPGPEIEVRPSRSDASSSTTRCLGDAATIRIAAEQATVATLAHELGHSLAGAERGHDNVFRAAYLDTVVAVTNAASTDRRHEMHVDQLAAAFTSAGLAVGGRRWSPPGDGRAIAL